VERLVKKLPKASVTVVSASEDPVDIAKSYKVGARGYVAKSSSSDTLRHALPLILSGETFIPSSAIAILTDAQKAKRKWSAAPLNGPKLTPRQQEILLLMAQGMQNKNIASELGMLEGTVKVHVKSILQKMGVNNRTHAVVTGIRRGLVPASLILPDSETGR
jgi:DNA-binding NarL/FixJ family response regulator